MAMPPIAYLECARCHHHLDAATPQTLCTVCAGPLYVRYDLSAAAGTAQRDLIGTSEQDRRWSGMWRYSQVLPDVEPVTLGEGWTPMLRSRRNPSVWLKEEGANPTGTFKARGLALAVTMARHYGIKKLAAPSAGNAGGALAAYAAAAGIEAHIFMPKDVPLANQVECRAYGAHLTLVDGLISDCGRIVAERKQAEGWFDISTLKEPFRVEGKKTMGYELVEQLGWQYPDAVFYPTGGGVGLIGMWKAFEELEQLGWVSGRRPKMIAIQAAGCAPVARAFEQGEPASQMWQNAHTFASGCACPSLTATRRFSALCARRTGPSSRSPTTRSLPRCWTGRSTKGCCSHPRALPLLPLTIICWPRASSSPATAWCCSIPAQATSTPM
jgi:threonine synthase